jgi:hypothetical protein
MKLLLAIILVSLSYAAYAAEPYIDAPPATQRLGVNADIQATKQQARPARKPRPVSAQKTVSRHTLKRSPSGKTPRK